MLSLQAKEVCVVPCSVLLLWESCLTSLRFNFHLCKVGVVIITLTFRVVSGIQDSIFEKGIYECFTIWQMLDFTFLCKAWFLEPALYLQSTVASLGSILLLQHSCSINMRWSHFRWFQLRRDLCWSSNQGHTGTGKSVLLWRTHTGGSTYDFQLYNGVTMLPVEIMSFHRMMRKAFHRHMYGRLQCGKIYSGGSLPCVSNVLSPSVPPWKKSNHVFSKAKQRPVFRLSTSY